MVYFAAVAKIGSITKAALLLDTVQSNVTQRIRRLEQELGVPLFHRHGRGVTLTVAGTQLLPYASRIDHMMEEARRVIVNEMSPGGALRIGSMETTAALRLPDVLVDYATQYPLVDISLQTGTTQSLIEDVLERRVEAALVAGPVDHIDLASEIIASEELVVVTAPWYPNSTRTHAGWVLSQKEVKIAVFRNGCMYREKLEFALIRHGVASIRKMELGTLEGLLGCVRAGIAVSMLPRAVVESYANKGQVAVHELPNNQGAVDTVLIRRRDAYRSSALNCFTETLRQHNQIKDVAAGNPTQNIVH
ncbi:MAG TPA: LysR family transcriptional regulator [Pseudomonas sp.]|uniref:LysR family transcriptional regulator n=1 Tax=Pseudomonas sp. TaxID=306 RepID=UPI002ED7A61E